MAKFVKKGVAKITSATSARTEDASDMFNEVRRDHLLDTSVMKSRVTTVPKRTRSQRRHSHKTVDIWATPPPDPTGPEDGEDDASEPRRAFPMGGMSPIGAQGFNPFAKKGGMMLPFGLPQLKHTASLPAQDEDDPASKDTTKDSTSGSSPSRTSGHASGGLTTPEQRESRPPSGPPSASTSRTPSVLSADDMQARPRSFSALPSYSRSSGGSGSPGMGSLFGSGPIKTAADLKKTGRGGVDSQGNIRSDKTSVDSKGSGTAGTSSPGAKSRSSQSPTSPSQNVAVAETSFSAERSTSAGDLVSPSPEGRSRRNSILSPNFAFFKKSKSEKQAKKKDEDGMASASEAPGALGAEASPPTSLSKAPEGSLVRLSRSFKRKRKDRPEKTAKSLTTEETSEDPTSAPTTPSVDDTSAAKSPASTSRLTSFLSFRKGREGSRNSNTSDNEAASPSPSAKTGRSLSIIRKRRKSRGDGGASSTDITPAVSPFASPPSNRPCTSQADISARNLCDPSSAVVLLASQVSDDAEEDDAEKTAMTTSTADTGAADKMDAIVVPATAEEGPAQGTEDDTIMESAGTDVTASDAAKRDSAGAAKTAQAGDMKTAQASDDDENDDAFESIPSSKSSCHDQLVTKRSAISFSTDVTEPTGNDPCTSSAATPTKSSSTTGAETPATRGSESAASGQGDSPASKQLLGKVNSSGGIKPRMSFENVSRKTGKLVRKLSKRIQSSNSSSTTSLPRADSTGRRGSGTITGGSCSEMSCIKALSDVQEDSPGQQRPRSKSLELERPKYTFRVVARAQMAGLRLSRSHQRPNALQSKPSASSVSSSTSKSAAGEFIAKSVDRARTARRSFKMMGKKRAASSASEDDPGQSKSSDM
eukprot:scpid26107/ scgid3972/ 